MHDYVVRGIQPGTVKILDFGLAKRITFYDIDSHPIEKQLTQIEKLLYLKEIEKNISYYRKSYDRAHLRIDISGLSAVEAAKKLHQSLNRFL